ncbi:hypothetical protein L2725_12190 [Shewanella corallii]|uniref:Uncharacterized protein n=1 Tax=Shewanella corallii TaxID=560080 RepID=A0ABT0N7V8_9GAMM|nr:hypothetical protein [Shewanella corallii]MCL2914526.1 hypothetical protein [Shewanella corallii]
MLTSDKLAEAPKEGEKALLGKTEIGFVHRDEAGLTPEPSSYPLECVLSQNAEYMDIGASEFDHKPSGWFRTLGCLLLPAFIFIVLAAASDPGISWLPMGIVFGLGLLWLVSGMVYYVLRRRRRTTISFYRKRQKLVFKPSSRAEPVELDWGDVVPYIRPRRIRGVIGSRFIDMPGVSLCLAWYDSESQMLHTF